MRVVRLNEVEQELVQAIASARVSECRAAGAQNTPMGGLDQDEIDLDGFGAELAFCKEYNYYPDLTTHARVGGCDVVSRDGQRIDIKHTKWDDGHLISRITDKGKADIYVLVTGEFPEYTIRGYAMAELLLSRTKDFGYGETYALPQSELRAL